VGAFGGSVGRFHGPREGEPREDSRRVDVAASARTRLSFPAARRGEVSDRASPEGCQIKGRPRFTRDDGVSPGRPPPENGAFARDATYLGAFRDARVFRGGDLRVVKGRERSATATRPSRRASVAEGSRTRCDVVRGGNAGGVRLGARRERRRTMMGDSYFTSVSTGGIGMAPGLLRRKRPARRSLSQSTRARPHSTNSAFRVSAVCRVELLPTSVFALENQSREAELRMGFYPALSFDLHLVPRWLSDGRARARRARHSPARRADPCLCSTGSGSRAEGLESVSATRPGGGAAFERVRRRGGRVADRSWRGEDGGLARQPARGAGRPGTRPRVLTTRSSIVAARSRRA
jgi:hypothetical protein